MYQPNTVITYALLFDSLYSHDKNDVLRNIKRWLNDVYNDKHPQHFETISSCTILNNIKIYRLNSK